MDVSSGIVENQRHFFAGAFLEPCEGRVAVFLERIGNVWQESSLDDSLFTNISRGYVHALYFSLSVCGLLLSHCHL